MSPLFGAVDIRKLAEELDIRPTKTRGQNFVIDGNTIRRIVAAAGIDPSEHVLEVGPGLGSLTLGLIDAARHVTAIEIEEALAQRLPATVAQWRPGRQEDLTLIHADALRVTQVAGEPTALVANLPYNVAVPVLLHLLATVPSLEHGLVMVQDEVADRLVEGPGSRTYGVPSVKTAWYAHARKAGVIGKNVFWPAPKIHSGLVAFTRHEPPRQDVARVDVFRVIDAAFAQRRKTLRAALSGWAGGGVAAEEFLRAAGVDPQARGESLGIKEFAAIAAAAQAAGHVAGQPDARKAPDVREMLDPSDAPNAIDAPPITDAPHSPDGLRWGATS
nr:16S rRNA (adenine(1518)-N(6)/adenine(1519)-N(6))-dimethyltransferase RsmA [Galactobacter caseinivorans]